jgi:hypothetical protein
MATTTQIPASYDVTGIWRGSEQRFDSRHERDGCHARGVGRGTRKRYGVTGFSVH